MCFVKILNTAFALALQFENSCTFHALQVAGLKVRHKIGESKMLRRDGHVEIADVFLNLGELLENFTDEYVGHWLPPVDANHRTSRVGEN